MDQPLAVNFRIHTRELCCIPTWDAARYRYSMSTQTAVRLPDELVARSRLEGGGAGVGGVDGVAADAQVDAQRLGDGRVVVDNEDAGQPRGHTPTGATPGWACGSPIT